MMKVKLAEIEVPNSTYGYVFDYKSLESIKKQFLDNPKHFTVVHGETVIGKTDDVYIEGNSLYADISVINDVNDLDFSYKPCGMFSFIETPDDEPNVTAADKIKIYSVGAILK